jgi:hypothetical protein
VRAERDLESEARIYALEFTPLYMFSKGREILGGTVRQLFTELICGNGPKRHGRQYARTLCLIRFKPSTQEIVGYMWGTIWYNEDTDD